MTQTTWTLDDEPFGSCTAHGLVLRQYASVCTEHVLDPAYDDNDCVIVLVGCPQGCEISERHS